MDVPELIVAIITLAVAAGGATAFFARSRGQETISLLQANISAYKDSEKLKDARIVYLEGQLVVKDETIKRILKNDSSSK
jgi:hypothetical protein